jgi:hypothetical protein
MPPLALGMNAGFDQGDHRRDALHLRFLKIAKEVFAKMEIAGMSFPEIDERSRINADNGVRRQILF